MTIQEFNQTEFTANMNAIYKNAEYQIASVDFEEKLIGLFLKIEGGDPEEISWVRCENVELVVLDGTTSLLNIFSVSDRYLECDNPTCDYTDTAESDFSDMNIYIGKPCPKCGENLLTEDDYKNSQNVLNVVNYFNALPSNERESLIEACSDIPLDSFQNVTVAQELKYASPNQMVGMEVATKNGELSFEIKPITDADNSQR